MTQLFISHSNLEDDIANRVHDALTQAGIDTWIDQVHGINGPKDEVFRQICDVINDCAGGIFLLSPNSLDSKDCCEEWQSILKWHKPLYVAIVGHVPDDQIPHELLQRNPIDLTRDFEAGMKQLISAIKRQPASTP